MTGTAAPPRASEQGLTLLEVVVSLMIAAYVVIHTMGAMGDAVDNVIVTRERRKMRYLAQIIMTRVELGKISPEEEWEPFEEGTSGSFEDWGSPHAPDEYARYEYRVDVLREVAVAGGMGPGGDPYADSPYGGDPYGQDPYGAPQGRPVTNDPMGGLFGEEEEEEQDAQLKRIVVLTLHRVSRDADDDRYLRLMTMLPVPGEEEQPLGSGAGGAMGGAPGGAGGEGGGGEDRGSGDK